MAPSGSRNPFHNPNIANIIIAIIGAIAVVLAALIGPQIVVNINEQGQSQGQATAIAELQPTIDRLRDAPTPTTKLVEVTQVVVATQIVEVTRIVEATRVLEVTRIVEVTPIPTATPTPPINTPPDSLLEVGQTWKQDGVELTLVSYNIDTDGIQTTWIFRNNTTQRLLVSYGNDNFSAIDNLQRPLINYGFRFDRPGGSIQQPSVEKFVEPGETIKNTDGGDDKPLKFGYISSCQMTEVVITAANVSRIERAQWRILTPSC